MSRTSFGLIVATQPMDPTQTPFGEYVNRLDDSAVKTGTSTIVGQLHLLTLSKKKDTLLRGVSCVVTRSWLSPSKPPLCAGLREVRIVRCTERIN